MVETWGQKNTKFFHSKASQRQRRNYIKGIVNLQEHWVEKVEDIARVAVDYFDNLFCAGSCNQMEECLSTVSAKVTPDMQDMLSRDFTVDETKEAVFQMEPTKAPRLDGMNALFYQNSSILWVVMQ